MKPRTDLTPSRVLNTMAYVASAVELSCSEEQWAVTEALRLALCAISGEKSATTMFKPAPFWAGVRASSIFALDHLERANQAREDRKNFYYLEAIHGIKCALSYLVEPRIIPLKTKESKKLTQDDLS